MKKRGFTLIELLVVIAIIGILASVVLASLNTARGKGANAAIKANLANIRAQAELVYDDTSPNGYGTAANGVPGTTNGTCAGATAGSLFANSIITNATAAAIAAAGSGATSACTSSTSVWAASVQLKVAEDTNTHWCIDSAGSSKGTTANLAAGATAC